MRQSLPLIGVTGLLLGVVGWLLLHPIPVTPTPEQVIVERVVTRIDTVLARQDTITRIVTRQVDRIERIRDTLRMFAPDTTPRGQWTDSLIQTQDTLISVLQQSRDSLLTALRDARDSLVPVLRPKYRTTLTADVSTGYLALYDGSLVTGPGVVAGITLTQGRVGITLGGGALLSGGKLHAGLAVGVGLRLRGGR